MPKHYVVHKQIAQKRSADLASKRPVLLPIHVLRSDLNVLRVTERFSHFRDRGEWRHDHHVDIIDFAYVPKERFHKSRRFGLRHVHLPISSHNFFAHKRF